MNRIRNLIFVLLMTACSLVGIAAVGTYYLIATPAGVRALVHGTLLWAGQYATVTVESYSGTIDEGLILNNIEIRNWPFLGPQASVRIQRADVTLPLLEPNVKVHVFNGRLDLPNCDTALFNGNYSDGSFQVNLFSKALDVVAIMRPFLPPEVVKNLQGTVLDNNLMLTGTLSNPRIRGHFYVDHIKYMGTVVREGLARFDLAFIGEGSQWRMYGPLILESGTVNVRRSTIELAQSRAIFKGDIEAPALVVYGTAKNNDYTIDMTITGTLAKPQMKVRSDPYMPEDMAMMALGLGSWMPTYFTLAYGGGNEKMGLKKRIGDDLNVGFALEESPALTSRQQEYSRTLEGELSITEKLSVNVAEKLNPSRSDTQTGASSQADNRSQGESLLYLKYKNTF